MHILDTPRLILRTVEVADAGFYLGLVNDHDFIAHIGDRGIRTLTDAIAAIEQGPMKMQAVLGFSIYVAALKDGGRPIGMCGLIKRDTLPGVDIGYAFLPAYRGHGYALEAAAAVVQHARSTIGLARLLAIASPQNLRSQALLEKIGMRFDRLIVLAPGESHTKLYELNLLQSHINTDSL